jgi:SAM-dependent methyltransferase
MIPEHKLHRRVVGHHDIRMDGISDLVLRAPGASVIDIGCNRGLVGFEFANNGAAVVHGCDNYEEGIATARQVFCDLRNVRSRFEVVDLTLGPDAMQAAFGESYLGQYDIVLMLATYHKLKRIMERDALNKLMLHFAKRTGTYFGWRGRVEEMAELDQVFGSRLKRIHTSEISVSMESAAAIWRRVVSPLEGE